MEATLSFLPPRRPFIGRRRTRKLIRQKEHGIIESNRKKETSNFRTYREKERHAVPGIFHADRNGASRRQGNSVSCVSRASNRVTTLNVFTYRPIPDQSGHNRLYKSRFCLVIFCLKFPSRS